MIKNKENIKLKYDYELKGINIQLDNKKRLIKDFVDIEIDATIVEILPEDNIEEYYFLEPENNNIKNIINNPIYIPQYPHGNKFCYSTGFIKYIKDNEITYNATTKEGSSGSPIFLENSIKVIGIHKEGNIYIEENHGNFIYPIIEDLQNNNINKNIKGEYNKYKYKDGKYYIGPILNRLPNGKGKIYYKNNNLYYEGDIKNGIKEGNGKIYFENGNYYVGQFTNDQITGKGKEYYNDGCYVGDFVNGLKHGKGKYYWKNGEIYEGDYVNGKREGYGKYIYEEGNYYEGFWMNNLKHGKGKQFYKNGALQSDIDFVNDKIEGFGRYTYENGEYYIGEWHNGLKHGKGKIYFKNGKIKYDGNFINDKFEEYGEYYFDDGEYYKGNFQNEHKSKSNKSNSKIDGNSYKFNEIIKKKSKNDDDNEIFFFFKEYEKYDMILNFYSFEQLKKKGYKYYFTLQEKINIIIQKMN